MRTKKVYIVEDNPLNIELYLAILNQIENIEVFVEKQGDKGLNLIKLGDPDLCILDYDIPVLNGVKICKELRKIEKFQKIPIIVISSSPIKGNKDDIFREAGFDKWFEKPLNVKEFKNNITNLLFQN
ncbi:response regulator [Promethearchaeum syntrophicum]|uniref:Response regulator n=1 Tax=Promethearchaeum syntrophicum TaxID=2594042 RepID=A0A5B9DC84_9ARCH|nr:response regulator [Candidatus Prometheoarchaeum syntrophicum]QEE16615.1 aerobic respiration control sensor protein ArcB [Candidatus Prometheoarchaeum syntrophicum]